MGIVLCGILLLSGAVALQTLIRSSLGLQNAGTTSDSTVASPCTVNCSAGAAPVLKGWGALALYEAGMVVSGTNDLEAHIQKARLLGYNAIRVHFDSGCTSTVQESPYSSAELQTAVNLAKKYNFWIIVTVMDSGGTAADHDMEPAN